MLFDKLFYSMLAVPSRFLPFHKVVVNEYELLLYSISFAYPTGITDTEVRLQGRTPTCSCHVAVIKPYSVKHLCCLYQLEAIGIIYGVTIMEILVTGEISDNMSLFHVFSLDTV